MRSSWRAPRPSPCPHCGKMQDAVSRADPFVDDHTFTPGDVALCIDCGSWTVLADTEGTRRVPSVVEQAEIEALPECRQASRAWREMKRNQLFKSRP